MNTEQNKVNNQEQTENLMERMDVQRETQTDKIVNRLSPNTYVPIGVLIVVIAVGVYVGSIATKVDAMVAKDSPSRNEYNQMCTQLNKIESKVDTVNDNLLKLSQRDKN